MPMSERCAYQASKQDLIFSTLPNAFQTLCINDFRFGFLVTLMAHKILMVLLLTQLANPMERGLKLF
jgi:hypothetical protein